MQKDCDTMNEFTKSESELVENIARKTCEDIALKAYLGVLNYAETQDLNAAKAAVIELVKKKLSGK